MISTYKQHYYLKVTEDKKLYHERINIVLLDNYDLFESNFVKIIDIFRIYLPIVLLAIVIIHIVTIVHRNNISEWSKDGYISSLSPSNLIGILAVSIIYSMRSSARIKSGFYSVSINQFRSMVLYLSKTTKCNFNIVIQNNDLLLGLYNLFHMQYHDNTVMDLSYLYNFVEQNDSKYTYRIIETCVLLILLIIITELLYIINFSDSISTYIVFRLMLYAIIIFILIHQLEPYSNNIGAIIDNLDYNR